MLSKSLRARPSELYGIHDDYVAFCFDRAVTTFGLAVEGAIQEATRDAKNHKAAKQKTAMVLRKWLTTNEEKKFKDPAKRG